MLLLLLRWRRIVGAVAFMSVVVVAALSADCRADGNGLLGWQRPFLLVVVVAAAVDCCGGLVYMLNTINRFGLLLRLLVLLSLSRKVSSLLCPVD
jgi:hypothetical protein